MQPQTPISEVIALFRSFYPRGHAVSTIIELVQLEEKRRARVGTLSGGQKQRTALARALMVAPRLLILDDALSAVDTFTEEEILTRLRGVMRQRTSLIVSHRVSTVRDADRIFVLDRGRIAEEGLHDELVSRGGLYATLHRRQLLEEELAAS